MNRMIDVRSVWFWLSVAALVIMFVFIVYPIINIVTSSFSNGGGWSQILSEQRYGEAIANSLMLAAIVTVACTLVGVPLAYVTARFRFPGKSLIVFLPLITLVIPEVIAAQTWLMMLGNNGLITRFFRNTASSCPASTAGSASSRR